MPTKEELKAIPSNPNLSISSALNRKFKQTLETAMKKVTCVFL
jgi:hypothetical protein